MNPEIERIRVRAGYRRVSQTSLRKKTQCGQDVDVLLAEIDRLEQELEKLRPKPIPPQAWPYDHVSNEPCRFCGLTTEHRFYRVDGVGLIAHKCFSCKQSWAIQESA